MWRHWLEALAGAAPDPGHSLLIFARLAPLGALPFFNLGRLPFVRTVLVLALTFFFSLSVQPLPLQGGFFGALVTELLLGIFLWVIITTLFSVFEVAGSLAGRLRGGTDPDSSLGEMSATAVLFSGLAVVLFFVSGGHLLFIGALGRLFRLIPPGGLLATGFDVPGILGTLLLAVGYLLTTGILLAIPLVATVMMTDAAVGVLSRFYPAINAFFLVMPLKALFLTFLLMLTVSLIPYFFSNVFELVTAFVTTLQL